MRALICLFFSALLTVGQAVGRAPAQENPPPTSTTPPALKIVRLLWTAQPAGASTALEKAIDQALQRAEVEQLKPHLEPLVDKMLPILAQEPSDPRWLVSVAALTISGNSQALETCQRAVAQAEPKLTTAKREFLLRCWLASQPQPAQAYLTESIARAQPSSDTDAAWLETCALRSLETNRAPATELLIKRWNALPRSVQLSVIEPLTHTADSMQQLVSAIDQQLISKDLLNTNQLMKWVASDNSELKAAIEKVWGRLRIAEDSDRKQVVERVKELLSSGKSGNPAAGQLHFKRICSQCHRLHGEGIELGPDITGNGRGSFEQLVSNVMDPSLVIGKAFTAKTILASDGRVVSGLLVAEDADRITLKVQGGKQIEFDRHEDIDSIKDSTKSLMPDGLEAQMSEQELLDLFAYLSLAKPLNAGGEGAQENTTIPGTPPALIP